MSSFLRSHQLCDQEVLIYFLNTIYSNKMVIYMFLYDKINIENNSALLASLLCVQFDSLHSILKMFSDNSISGTISEWDPRISESVSKFLLYKQRKK